VRLAANYGILCFLLTVVHASFAAPSTNTETARHVAAASTETDAAYNQSLEKRVGDVLSDLKLTDSAKAARVHDLLTAQYRALRDWHDANDAKLKRAAEEESRQIRASLKRHHNQFVASLSAELPPEQVEQVKDKMTYGTVKVTYNAYCEIVPNLTTAEKQKILELLKEGREEAMDGGSHNEKAAIFKKYKGKINNYLDSQGHNVKQAYKDWGAKQKDKAALESSKIEN
jgi:hypothetical protein